MAGLAFAGVGAYCAAFPYAGRAPTNLVNSRIAAASSANGLVVPPERKEL
jgi:hypothetical protein